MSGGQQQRVTIARALVNGPAIVWADEPTGALDSESGMYVMDLLCRLNRERGQTFILVTHDAVVGSRAGRMVWMRDGHVLPEVYLEVHDSSEERMARLRVIGVIEDQALFLPTVITGHETLQRLAGRELPYLKYEIALRNPSRADEVAAALEEEFIEHGTQALPLEKAVRDHNALNFMVSQIIQGFMGLGLVVGIAALGVIVARSVVERRVQIGILRAIGYGSGMIRVSFLIESSFIALFGIVLGLGLGFGLSVGIVRELDVLYSDIRYVVPWTTVALVAIVAYGASLLTTYLPARQASAIYPAEALRYDE